MAQVYDLIIQGHSMANVMEFCKDKLGVDGLPLIMESKTRMMDAARTPRDLVLGFCMEGLKDLYNKSVLVGDLANAAKCLKQLSDVGFKKDVTKPPQTKTKAIDIL
jgi:hypothetical protein